MPGVARLINSIARGADVLRCLSTGVDRISDISERLALSKSTVHRLLKSLENSEFVIEDRMRRRYYLGPLILNLSSKPIVAHQRLVISAFSEMKRLRDLSRETVILHIRAGVERICLEELQSLENIKYTAGKGVTAPLYIGSAGKVLLSELDAFELDFLLDNVDLKPLGPNTITDKQELLHELERVREQGYATSFRERLPEGASISVPVKGYMIPVALSVLGPDNRFSREVMMEIVEEIKKGAANISSRLLESKQWGERYERQISNP
jgi:DNA-binding IclR family transcriptional regulator